MTAMEGRRLHFVGIAGAGMSGLALIAKQLGATVTGSDRATAGPYVDRLRAAGIEPAAGHTAANVPPHAEVVYSSAIPADNPERTTGAPELHRADFLAELTEIKPAICVSGTHGKTTTTSMIVHALRGCGMDPAYSVGGEVRSTGTNAAWGDGPYLVVEADESDRSLVKLHPRIAVVTNAELDHHATYGSLRDVLNTFATFVADADQVIVGDDPNLLALRADATPFDVPDPDLSGGTVRFTFDGVPVQLGLPGHHNALNAAAALMACRAAGADLATAAAALKDFTGAGRRFEALGETAAGARVVDDYAHHPTEVAATIAAARTLPLEGRIVAVFQPHLFSRTQAEARGFGVALAAADAVVVTGIYPARERQEDFPGVTGELIAAAARDGGARDVTWAPTLDDAYAHLQEALAAGDLCLTIGAGDVDSLGHRLVTS
ncbi:MAG: UDP-N-acetylmuramate--alanine ligase [Solirubrobacteraceae bacterium]|nr:UDP-N-acetylmuramate--alanine ligase [Solirubrobacteraceae bacterium]